MAVPAVNLTIEKGADFITTLKLKTDGAPIDLTGYTFSAKLKKHFGASTSYSFTVTPLTPFSNGVVRVGMAKTTTSQIPTGRYVWDLLISLSGTTTKASKGNVIVEGTVS